MPSERGLLIELLASHKEALKNLEDNGWGATTLAQKMRSLGERVHEFLNPVPEPEPVPPEGEQYCDMSVGGCGHRWTGGSYPCENGSWYDEENHEFRVSYCGAQRCPKCGTCQGALSVRRKDQEKVKS